MAATLVDPLLGHLIDGRYEVLSRIARGGMATVYLARDRRLDREVAIKVMHAHLAEGTSGAEFVARFRREARSAARLTHPGLVGVLDQGVDGETSYLTMEYIDGTNLRRHLGERGSLTVGEALDTADAVLDALSAAHRVELVHRDIKPENVLLAADGRIKVADFGLARAVTEVTSTTTGTILGTVAYLAPELVAHGTSDTRTDVYAVGILLYEMLTGRQPFVGATPIQVAYQHVHSDIPAPSDAVEWLPIEVDELVRSLASREPAERPADARAALDLLRRTRGALDDATLTRRADVAPTIVLPSATVDGEEVMAPGASDDDAAGEPATEAEAPAAAPEREPSADGAAAVGPPPPPASSDPFATQRITVTAPAPPDDDHAPGRTVALRIGEGLGRPGGPEVPVTGDGRPARSGARRRRRALLLALVVIAAVAATAFGARWYVSTGPGAYTTVPDGVVGADLADAQAVLAGAGLTGAPTEVFDPEAPKGTVLESAPEEGERILKEGSVALAVSKGPDLRVVPEDLAGKPVADATAALTEAGFVVPDPIRTHDDQVAPDHVIIVSAEAGAQLPVGTEVQLTVSDGPAPVTVSSVVGIPAADAKLQLESQGLKVAEAQDYSETVPAGSVIAQSPEANAQAKRTDTVTITVSQGPPLVDIPNVLQKSPGSARETLEGAGFVVDINYGIFGRFPGARVVEQSPIDGQAPKGSTITLTVQ